MQNIQPTIKFTFKVKKQNGIDFLFLEGSIDEDSNLTGHQLSAKTLRVNFKHVTHINSLGIRNWVNFLKQVPAEVIFYEECPPAIVHQLNMIPSFKGKATVESVYVPFVCDACEAETLILADQSSFQYLDKWQEKQICHSCKAKEMSLDGTPKTYFAFAATTL